MRALGCHSLLAAPRTGGGMADVASDVRPVGAYDDMASWVTVPPEKARKQYL